MMSKTEFSFEPLEEKAYEFKYEYAYNGGSYTATATGMGKSRRPNGMA